MTDFWRSDPVLSALGGLPEPIRSLIRAFPGRDAESDEWIGRWFRGQIDAFFSGSAPDPPKLKVSAAAPDELLPLAKPPVSARVRLISLMPRYFRGFRTLRAPVSFEGDLVLLEGRNSSGKTSISEAIEWLFTGELSRRSFGGQGHHRELARCITNEFRPATEKTFVECVLDVDGKQVALRRVLTEDYSERAGARPQSDVFVDGTRSTQEAYTTLLNSLFAGVPPLLMQHTLHEFVYNTPAQRREYFERLLQIDQLTALIEKAVVGDQGLGAYPPPTGAVSHTRWVELRDSLSGAVHSGFVAVEQVPDPKLSTSLDDILVKAAHTAFGDSVPSEASSIDEIIGYLSTQQTRAREARYPFVALLRPGCGVESLQAIPASLKRAVDSYSATHVKLETARKGAASVTAANAAVSRAFDELVTAGLVDPATVGDVLCPLCAFGDQPTLSPNRISEIQSWQPLASALDAATDAHSRAQRDLLQTAAKAKATIALFAPKTLNEASLETQLDGVPDSLVSLARSAREALEAAAKALRRWQQTLAPAIEAGEAADSSVGSLVDAFISESGGIIAICEDAWHRAQVLEQHTEVEARDDPSYRLRDDWLAVAGDRQGIMKALRWERAKKQAQDFLATLRTALIALRSEIIESARQRFSSHMSEVWDSLRQDRASRFEKLSIPKPRGRGYKLEIEVKALLNDGQDDTTVDALKVFSESQINVLGLAAFMTRGRLLGHTLYVFDDPVQSMDEEHFRSFARTLLPLLLAAGHQVVVLTHSDMFARDILDQHFTRPSFVTMKTRASRRHGCLVDEGNRRVAARLKRATRLAEDGKLDDAWRDMRLALERLYLLAYVVAYPEFDPRTWRGSTAEDMWNNGAGDVITAVAPDAAMELREILSMTAAGAHEKPSRGMTDLTTAAKLVRSIMGPLRVGDG